MKKPYWIAALCLSTFSYGNDGNRLYAERQSPAESSTALSPIAAQEPQSGSTADKIPAGKAASALAVGAYRPGAGTVILAELSKSLAVKKLKVDDTIEASILQDLLYKGKIIVPRNSKVVGHVTEVMQSSKDHPESHVGVVFEKIMLPGKKELSFQYPAIILAIAAPIRGKTVQTTKVTDMPVQMQKGKDTGAAVLDAVSSNAQLAGANMSTTVGVISAADRGVIGIKDLGLDNSHAGYSVLVSPKGSLHLDFDVQLVLQVTSPATQQK